MWWFEAERPLAHWAAARTDLPPRGRADASDLVWFGAGAISTAISPTTGGWAVVSAEERAALERIGVADLPPDLLVAAWRRGLISIDGATVVSLDGHFEVADDAKDHYGLILVLGEGCNIVCSYCYLGHEQPRASSRMDVAMAEAAIAEAVRRPAERIIVDLGEIAIGGSLVGHLMEFATAEAQRVGANLQLTVQTNGTTLDGPTVARLAAFGVQVGVSLDGPRELHDLARVTRSGLGTYDAVVDGLARLRDAGVEAHLIATIGRHNAGSAAAVLDAIWEQRPASYLLKPVLAEGEADDAWDDVGITSGQYARFVSNALDHIEAAGADHIDQSMQKFLFRLLGDRRGWKDGCTSRRCGAGSSLHVVMPGGRVHSCPRFIASGKGTNDEAVGPVPVRLRRSGGSGPGRSAVQAAPRVVAPVALLDDSLRAAPASCAGCPWLASCGGGCTLVGSETGSLVPEPDPHCLSYEVLHRWLLGMMPDMIAGLAGNPSVLGGATVAGARYL